MFLFFLVNKSKTSNLLKCLDEIEDGKDTSQQKLIWMDNHERTVAREPEDRKERC